MGFGSLIKQTHPMIYGLGPRMTNAPSDWKWASGPNASSNSAVYLRRIKTAWKKYMQQVCKGVRTQVILHEINATYKGFVWPHRGSNLRPLGVGCRQRRLETSSCPGLQSIHPSSVQLGHSRGTGVSTVIGYNSKGIQTLLH